MRVIASAIIAVLAAPIAVAADTGKPATTSLTPPAYALDAAGKPTRASTAIPDVCAWPNLVQTTDGTILVTLFNQPSHGRMIGGVECWASTNGGLTWTKRATAVPPDPGGTITRMNHAFGLAVNGDLVLIVGGWTVYPKPNVRGPFEIDKLVRPCVARSSNGGETWTVNKDAFPATAPDGNSFVPFGAIVQAGGQDLLMSAYTTKGKAYVLRSHDDGATWADPTAINSDEDNINETTLLRLPTGRFIAAARARAVILFASDDSGRTWCRLGQASNDLGIPASLIALADGRLLLTHGNRQKGIEGVDTRISTDGGTTWSPPRRLADFLTYDGGYPSSVQRADGQIVTAYYARRTADRDAYHMGLVIWDPAKTFDAVTANPASRK